MNITKLYCVVRFPECWEEEYEERTGILASLESLEKLADKRPDKIIMTTRQLAQYKKLLGDRGAVPANMVYGCGDLFYNSIKIEVKNDSNRS